MQHQDTYVKPFVKNGTTGNAPDELDIISLIGKAVAYLYRYRFLFISFVVSGLALGLVYYFISPRQSVSKLILHSKLLTNQEEIEIIDGWNNLLAKRQYSTLAGIMNCRENAIRKMSSISAEEIQKVYSPNNPNGFVVNVTVSDLSVLDELQADIVYGLNNTPYVKEKLRSQRTRYDQLITTTKTEIESLKSTKQTVDNMINGKSSGSSPVVVDISKLNSSYIELNEKLLGYQEELRFLTGVYALENFDKGEIKRSLLKPLFFGFALGCFLAYMISLFLYVRQKLKAPKLDYSIH